MIEEWRESELYRRAQAIVYDPNPMAGRATYEEECRLFGAAQKGGRVEAFAAIADSEDAAAQRKAIFESLDDQTNAVERRRDPVSTSLIFSPLDHALPRPADHSNGRSSGKTRA